jgi:hypothetical protein
LGSFPACNEVDDPSSFVRASSDNASNPPRVLRALRSQIEIQPHFAPILRSKGKLFRKSASSYIRPAVIDETIVTVVDGKEETQKTVLDNTNMVVCGKAGEYYVLTREEFLDSYDENSWEQIPESTDAHLQVLRGKGFLEYQSKRFVWAKPVEKEDMDFFRDGADSSSDFAHYIAPWGAKDIIKEGDYLAMRHEENAGINDGVYRIDKGVFGETYVVAGKTEEACTDEEPTTILDRKKVKSKKEDKKELFDDIQMLKALLQDEDDPGLAEEMKAKSREKKRKLVDLM